MNAHGAQLETDKPIESTGQQEDFPRENSAVEDSLLSQIVRNWV